jgi:hypothetical protein
MEVGGQHYLFSTTIYTTLNKRLIGYDPDQNMTPDQLVDFLEEQVQDDLDGASIQEYLATFGMKMIWRIVPATEFGEVEQRSL